MLIKDKIAEVEKEILHHHDEYIRLRHESRTIVEKATYCGNCNKGYKRMSFADIPYQFSTVCECTGATPLVEKALLMDEEKAKLERQLEKLKTKKVWLAAKVGQDYIDKGIQTYNQEGNESGVDILVKWYRTGMKEPLLLMGKSGSGKTHLLSGICNQMVIDEIDFHYVEAYQIDDMTNFELVSSEKRRHLVHRMSTVKALVVDDLPKSKLTEALYSHVWFPILQNRRNNRLITIYTMDKSIDELWRTYSDSKSVDALKTRILWKTDDKQEAVIIPLSRRTA